MKPDIKRDNTGNQQTAAKERRKAERRPNPEEVLDEALEGTFPASDPVSLVQPVKKRRKR